MSAGTRFCCSSASGFLGELVDPPQVGAQLRVFAGHGVGGLEAHRDGAEPGDGESGEDHERDHDHEQEPEHREGDTRNDHDSPVRSRRRRIEMRSSDFVAIRSNVSEQDVGDCGSGRRWKGTGSWSEPLPSLDCSSCTRVPRRSSILRTNVGVGISLTGSGFAAGFLFRNDSGRFLLEGAHRPVVLDGQASELELAFLEAEGEQRA